MNEKKTRKVIDAHRLRVFQYMSQMSKDIMYRGNVHDESKLGPHEFLHHVRMIEEFEKHPFGTEGYDKAKEGLGPAVEHHFLHNRHHPEYFVDGINDMNLVDVIELLMDWKAATLNHSNSLGDILKSVDILSEKYNISPQLKRIFLNTIKDYEHE